MTDIEQNYLLPLRSLRQSLQAQQAYVHVMQALGLMQNQPGMHFHPHPELFIQLSGLRRFTCPMEVFDLESNNICIVPSRLPHRENAFNAKDAPFDGIVLWAEGETLSIHRSIVRENGGRPSIGPHLRLQLTNTPIIGRLLESASLINEADNRSGVLYALIGLIINRLVEHGREQPTAKVEPSAAIVHSARAIIHAYLPDANLSVSRIAAEVGCSADHLARCFQKHLGLCTQNYLQSERLNLACRLLKKPNLRICEIAWACGFHSANYFIRIFKQQMGRTPKQFRQT